VTDHEGAPVAAGVLCRADHVAVGVDASGETLAAAQRAQLDWALVEQDGALVAVFVFEDAGHLAARVDVDGDTGFLAAGTQGQVVHGVSLWLIIERTASLVPRRVAPWGRLECAEMNVGAVRFRTISQSQAEPTAVTRHLPWMNSSVRELMQTSSG
jgi:hypothetical protein